MSDAPSESRGEPAATTDAATEPLTSVLMARLLAEEIEQRGLTQAEFGRRVGASAKHVNVVLNGKASAYQATLDYWAFVLGCEWHVELRRRS